jgi:hypothetical protein
MSKFASGLSTVAMGISSISNAIDTFKNPDSTWIEKLTSGSMAAVMGISMLRAVIDGLNTTVAFGNKLIIARKVAQDASTISDVAQSLISAKTVTIKGAEVAVTKKLNKAQQEELATTYANIVADKLHYTQEQKDLLISQLKTKSTAKEMSALAANTL